MKPFEEIRVLDLSHAMAGPFCTMLLADLGAQVVKLENPHEGDHFRPAMGGATFAALNRNKLGISIDLKKKESREIVERLIRRSDVFIESFIPGTIHKIGLGYESVKALNPKIIYCSISGFGQTGPYKSLPGYDVVAQAMSGIMMCTGEADRPPVRMGPSLIDLGTGMYMVIGILKALMDREQTGAGQYIEGCLLETALSWMAPFITRYSVSGEIPQRMGSALAAFAPYQVYQASDGYVFLGVSTERFWRNFCNALQLENLIDDPRFFEMKDRVKNRDHLNAILEEKVGRMTVAGVLEKLRKAGVPCAPVLTLSQIIADPHVKERGILISQEDPALGKALFSRTPIRADGKMPDYRSSAPLLGQHTRQVLEELDFPEEEIRNFFEGGVAFEPESKD